MRKLILPVIALAVSATALAASMFVYVHVSYARGGVDLDVLCKRLQAMCESPTGIVATDSLTVLKIAVLGGECSGGCDRCDLD